MELSLEGAIAHVFIGFGLGAELSEQCFGLGEFVGLACAVGRESDQGPVLVMG